MPRAALSLGSAPELGCEMMGFQEVKFCIRILVVQVWGLSDHRLLAALGRGKPLVGGVWEPKSCKSSSKAGSKVQTLVLPVDNISSTGLPGSTIKHPPFLLLPLARFQCFSAASQFSPLPLFCLQTLKSQLFMSCTPSLQLGCPQIAQPRALASRLPNLSCCRTLCRVLYGGSKLRVTPLIKGMMPSYMDVSPLPCELIHKPLTNYLEFIPSPPPASN